MEIKHISRLNWDDLPNVESPFFARATIEQDRSSTVSFGISGISGLNEALRGYGNEYSPYGAQINSHEAFEWLLDQVGDGEFVLTDSSWTTPMKSVLRWSTEDNRNGYRVPLRSGKIADYTKGRWRVDPDLPMRLRSRIDECLEKARRSGRGPEHLWWGGVLESRFGGGGGDASGFKPPPEPARPVKPRSSAMDKAPVEKVDEKAKAQALFDELANDKNIPFDYPKDCCYARAHEMCRQLEAKGVKCGKTWYYSAGWPAKGSMDYPPASLTVSGLPKTDVIPDGTLAWTYHVAPTIEVGGKTMVFDPSMFKGPVTPDEWRSKMVNSTPDKGNPIIRNTGSTPFFVDPHGNAMEDPDYSETKGSFKEHEKERDKAKAAAAAGTK